MSLLEKNRPSSKTLAWVGGLHVLVLLIAFLIPGLFQHKPQEQFITMIPLGTENPGEGRPDSTDTDSGGSPAAGGIQGITPPSPQQVQVPVPAHVQTPVEPPVSLPPVQAIKPVPDPVRQEVKPVVNKVETVKPTPAPPVVKQDTPKPAEKTKSKVKVDLTKVVSKSSSTTTGNSSQSSNSKTTGTSSSGLSASDVEKKLLGKFGNGTGTGSGDKSGNAGISGGTGNGHIGQPNGIANAPWYDTYVAIQIKKNWTPPPAGGGVPFISVRILSDGTLEFLRLAKSSGNPELDQSAITAVQSVKKLGNPPPAGLPSPYEKIVEFK
jgi:protein TonB